VVSSVYFVRMNTRNIGRSMLLGPGWLLFIYLLIAQAIPAVDYELGVSMGTQESAQRVTEVGVAFWYGFAFGDLVTYIPLLGLGLVGYQQRRNWGRVMLIAALGITVYWPVVCLAAVVAVRTAPGWHIPSETPFWVVLPAIAAWGIWGLWHMATEQRPSPPTHSL